MNSKATHAWNADLFPQYLNVYHDTKCTLKLMIWNQFFFVFCASFFLLMFDKIAVASFENLLLNRMIQRGSGTFESWKLANYCTCKHCYFHQLSTLHTLQYKLEWMADYYAISVSVKDTICRQIDLIFVKSSPKSKTLNLSKSDSRNSFHIEWIAQLQ